MTICVASAFEEHRVVAPGALEEANWGQRQSEARDTASDLHLGATAGAGRRDDLVFAHGRTIAVKLVPR
jgi:hypothetical protein